MVKRKRYRGTFGRGQKNRPITYTHTLTGHFIRYTLLVPGWPPFCLQNCLNSSWQKFNKVLETFLRDFGPYWYDSIKSNQIKSNHFYCHITTAQVPWWVKFLWACSRQCRKTTDNLHMDRQCKKTTNNLHMDRQCKKNNKQFTYGQTVQKTALEHLQCSRQCKKNNNSNLHMDRQCKKNNNSNLHMDRQCKKNNNSNLHMDRQCKKKQQQFTYGQTVQKKQQQFTYGQYIFTDCTEDNVQNTHTCTQYA